MKILLRASFLCLLLILCQSALAVKLYWVGGSGNFNDPAHWSLTSGGPGGIKTPQANDDVCFDANSFDGPSVINLIGHCQVHDFVFDRYTSKLTLAGLQNESFTIYGNVVFNPYIDNQFAGEFRFRSAEASTSLTFSLAKFMGNVDFDGNTNWVLHDNLVTSDNSTTTFRSGTFKLQGASVLTGNLIAYAGVNVIAGETMLNVKNKFQIAPGVTFIDGGTQVYARTHDPARFQVPDGTFGNSSSRLHNQYSVSSTCNVTLDNTTTPTCAGACNGTVSFTIPASCSANPVYAVWTVGGSPCTTIPTATLTPGTTYTVGGLCGCAQQYFVNFTNDPNTQDSTYAPFAISIADPAPPRVKTLTSVKPKCFGGCDGYIIATIDIFGTPPITSHWTSTTFTGTVNHPGLPYNKKDTLLNVCAGQYTATLTDANGCNSTQTFTVNVTQPTKVNSVPTTTMVLCNGTCTGIIKETVSGGTPGAGYTYTWVPAGFSATSTTSTATYSNLCAGTYTFFTADMNSCKDTDIVTITQPPAITFVKSPLSGTLNIPCNNTCNGNVGISSVSGGTGAYSFTWTPTGGSVASGTNSSTYSGLCGSVAGNSYSVQIKDANNCTVTTTFTITSPPALSNTITVSQPKCVAGQGTPTGTATLTESGGVSPFTFTWTPSGTQGGTSPVSTFTGSPGTYTVNIADQNGCLDTANVTFTAPTGLSGTMTVTNPTCPNLNNGQMCVSATGGTGAYTYTWSPSAGTNSCTPSTLTVTPGGTSTYTVTVKDVNSCSVAVTGTLQSPPQATVTSAVTNPACAGTCNGSATLTPVGGTGPFAYQWSCSGITSNVLTGQCGGTSCSYTVTDQGSNCKYTGTVSFTVAPTLTLTVASTSLTCSYSCNSTITATAAGGTPAYTYSWTGTGLSCPTCSVETNMCAGTYSVKVTDNLGCSLTKTVSVSGPTAINHTVSVTNPKCTGTQGPTLGTATVTASGGTAGYTFTWTPGVTTGGTSPTSTGSNMPAGTYTVFIADANLCKDTAIVTLVPPTAISGSITTVTNPTCPNLNNGQLCVTPSGGTPAYSYTWSPTGGNSSCSASTLTVTAGGTSVYTVTIKDVNTCSVVVTGTLTSPPQATITSAVTNAGCGSNPCTASATLTPTGGTGPFTYQWSCSGSATNVISNQCAGTTCNYTVTDSGTGCKYTGSVAFAPAPPTLSVNISATALSCAGNCNSAITTTVSGGTSPFTYSWIGTGTNPVCTTCPTQTAMCVGGYTVTVTDNLGCTKTATVNLTSPPALTVNLTATQPSCNSSCNGAITTTVTGGVGPYSVVGWSPALPAPNLPNTPNPTNLCGAVAPGTVYTVTVSDGNGCTATGTDTITAPPVLTLTLTGTDVTCSGLCNGTATASASGGTAPYTYSWDGGAYIASSTSSGLCTGQHTVTVKDSKNCTTTQNITINQPNPLSVAVVNQINTCGPCTGSAGSQVNGGTPPYTYSWSPTGGNGSTTSNLCIGNYTLTVGDANNCPTASTTFTITPIVTVTISTTSQSISCNGGCNGLAIGTAITGQAPFSYTWTASPTYTTVTTCSSVASCTATGLCAGKYVVLAADANGCTNKDSITLVNPPVLTATASASNAACAGACSGSATVTASGGTAPYSYSWNTGATTQTVSGLCPGTYTATVTDNKGCVTTVTVNVSSSPQFSVSSTTSTPVACAGTNGSITVTAAGGVPSYTFAWSPAGTGTVTTTSPTSTLSGVAAGIYTVVITDQNGCDTTVQITLSDPGSATITATTQSVSCNGVSDGSATVTATSATSLTLTWQGTPPVTGSSPLTETLTALGAGTYTVQATDANGCSAFQNVTVPGPAAITDSLINIVNPTCNALGSISVTAGGGSHSYSYTWAPTGGNGPTASNLSPGVYTLTIADQGNPSCSQNFTYTLNPISTPTLIVNATNPTCSGLANGTATANVSGGVPAYTFTWTSGSSGVISSGSLNNVSSLQPDVYTVTVTDNGGCSTLQTFTLTSPAPLVSNLAHQNNLCNTGCTGSATVAPTGGTGTYTISWSPGAFTGPTVNSLCPANYTVTITDQNNCLLNDTFTVDTPSVLTVSLSTTNPTCNPGSNGTASVAISGGTPGYQITWTGVTCTNCTSVSGLSAGAYNVTVTDTNNCSVSKPFNLTNPPAISLNSTLTNPLCNLSCNGAITVTVSAGTSPFTFSWSPVGGTTNNTATTTTYTNLCAGNYSLTATDNNGCTASSTFSLSNPSPASLTSTSTDATCGQCNGSLTITSTSGTAPITINWLAPSSCGTSTVCTNLCFGVYKVELTDGNGCKDTFNLAVSNPNGPQIDSVVVNNACSGGSAGSISVTVNPANMAPYTFSWTPSSPGTVTTTTNSTSFTGLSDGVYVSTVQDNLGCGTATSFTITSPPVITVSGNVSNATCGGINNGTVTLTAQGGTPATAGGVNTYTYTLDGATSNTTGLFTGLAVGIHTVCVSDSLGCQVCNTYSIAPNIVINSQVSSTNINCYGNCNGTATVSGITGGGFPYVISWNDPNAQSATSATNLCAGSYTATITDTNGCVVTQTVTVTQPAALSITSAGANPSCGQCNGTATVTVSGGTPSALTGYTYMWNNGATTPNISNVCAGVWQVNITDSLQCHQSFQIPISNSSAPIDTVKVTSPVCGNSCSGTATVTTSGGVAPYTYSWPSFPGQTGNTIGGLCAGVTFVQVKDAAGCIATDSVLVTPGTIFTVATTMSNPGCNVCNGVITANVSGTGPYTYSWIPGSFTTSTISGVCAGLYTLVVTDVASGCTDTSLVGLNNNTNGPSLTFTTQDVLCNSACNGTATVSATGGTGPYTYQWNTATVDTFTTVSSLCPGNYGVVVIDINGCIQTGQITISQPNPLIASTSIANAPNCFGDCNASIFTVVSGGTPSYTYAWSPSTITGTSASGLCAGNYSVMVTDTNGCTVMIFDTLTNPPALVITGTTTPASCNTIADGAITTTSSGGVPSSTAPGYTWQWSGGSTATTPDLTNILVGNYTVIVFDSHNCSDTANFTVVSTSTVVVNAGNDTSACALNSIVLNGTVNAGTTVQWVQLPIPPGTVIGTTASVTITPGSGTTQYVLIGQNGGCTLSDTISVTSNPVPTPDAGQTISIFPGNTIAIGGNPTNPSGGTVSWSPGITLNDSTIANPVASPTVTTTYTVIETSSFGCKAIDTITVMVLPQFVIPNGFTPNGDGYNDVWQIDMIYLFPDCEVEVFNRWGEPLFYSKGYNTPWNGTYKGKPVPVGTYYYLIRLHDKEKKFPEAYTGPLTIMR